MCESGTGKKARIKNAIIIFGSYQDELNCSKISVICSLWPYVLLCVLCGVPQGCFFCWMWRRSDFFFLFYFITLLINNLEEGSVPNVAILAAATRKGLNTVESWIALTILWIVFSLGVDNWLTNFNGEKCEGMRPEASAARGDYAAVHMGVWGTICSCLL